MTPLRRSMSSRFGVALALLMVVPTFDLPTFDLPFDLPTFDLCPLTFALSPLSPLSLHAQTDGSVSVMFDALPDISDLAGRQDVAELRTRLVVDRRQELGAHLRVRLSGHVDGLVAKRRRGSSSGTAKDAMVRPLDLFAEVHGSKGDLRVGASRIVWGRLDEFQPTDVVNPIDLERFLLEGRSEARLASAMVRGRWIAGSSSTLEALIVPWFRESRLDQLDERRSPFNIAPEITIALPVERRKPAFAAGNLQGGARFTSSVGRVDWAATAYRGFRTFPVVSLVPPGGLLETFPRFTMLGADFETVRGRWGVRGEVAAFVDDTLQSGSRSVPGRRIDGGVGVDRRTGDYRLAGNVLWSGRRVDADVMRSAGPDADAEGHNLTLVASADRSFARETRTLRLFAVHDVTDRTTFARGIGAISLRDNVWLEASAGVFAGSSSSTLGRLTRRDFVYARLKAYF